MSQPTQTKRPVPEGKTRYVTTRQKPPTEQGFVGYETIWESFQKVAKYTTPKQP